MTLATVVFESGHKLHDNGVGDYMLDCPKKGDAGWLHMGMVARLTAQTCCPCCLQLMGNIREDSPRPYDFT